MTIKDKEITSLSPAVSQVVSEFLSAAAADEALTKSINDTALARLGENLRAGEIPKSEDLEAMLFESPVDGDSK